MEVATCDNLEPEPPMDLENFSLSNLTKESSIWFLISTFIYRRHKPPLFFFLQILTFCFSLCHEVLVVMSVQTSACVSLVMSVKTSACASPVISDTDVPPCHYDISCLCLPPPLFPSNSLTVTGYSSCPLLLMSQSLWIIFPGVWNSKHSTQQKFKRNKIHNSLTSSCFTACSLGLTPHTLRYTGGENMFH